MSQAIIDTYIEELANGHVPGPVSEEAKVYQAWVWAEKQLESIKAALVVDWDFA
jgi:hypothetical protein